MPNSIFEDRRLSIEARGVLGYLLTKPPRWHVDVRDIMRVCCIGEQKAYRCLNELKAGGYVRRLTPRNESGRFEKPDYLISDTPFDESRDRDKRERDQRGGENGGALVKTESDQSMNEGNTEGRGRGRGGRARNTTHATTGDRERDDLRRKMMERSDDQE